MRKFFKLLAAAAMVMCSVSTMLVPTVSAANTANEEATDPIQATEVQSELKEYEIDPTREVSLTMNAVTANETPISGVGYTIYLVSNDLNHSVDLPSIDKSKLEAIELPKTGEDGKATIKLKPEQQGIYLVSCTELPATVSKAQDDFLISLPFTLNGAKWEYDLNASPKLVLAETEPTTPTEKTLGNMNASTGSSAKSVAQTGENIKYIMIAAGVCAISFGIILVILKHRKTKTDEQ